MLEAARAAAAGHPTPQSRMAASGLVSDHGSITSPAGSLVTGRGGRPARLVDIIGGAEWGSSGHRQFAPRNTRGYWLVPAADSEAALDAGDRALVEILRKVT